MDTMFFVAEIYRYRSSGKWEFKAVNSYTTLYDAKNAFHARKAAITKESNDYAAVILFDMYTNRIMGDFDNTADPEPDPDPNTEE